MVVNAEPFTSLKAFGLGVIHAARVAIPGTESRISKHLSGNTVNAAMKFYDESLHIDPIICCLVNLFIFSIVLPSPGIKLKNPIPS